MALALSNSRDSIEQQQAIYYEVLLTQIQVSK